MAQLVIYDFECVTASSILTEIGGAFMASVFCPMRSNALAFSSRKEVRNFDTISRCDDLNYAPWRR